MSQTREQQWRRQRRFIQDALLKNYPNPARIACPANAVLLDMAERSVRLEILFEHEHWNHLTHCSPCYAIFLAATQRFRDEKN